MDPFRIDWPVLIGPNVPLAETVVRATVMYFVVFVLLRLIPNRHMGTIGIADLLVVVLMVAAVQPAMTTGARSIVDGLVIVGTIILWSHAFNWLGFHFPWFQRLLRPAPLPLILKGRLLRENMQRELITEDELMSQLRHQGVDGPREVKKAFMEGDGRISVVTHNGRLRPPEDEDEGT